MLGTDFELFFTQNGFCLPAIPAFEQAGYLERMQTKHARHTTDIAPEGYTTYFLPFPTGQVIEDGAAVECPCDPAETASELVEYVRQGIQATWGIAEAGGVDLQGAPLVHLRQEHIDTRPELRVLGCSPDIDLYGIYEGTPPQNPKTTLWRTGGGHIHFSPTGVFDTLNTQATVLLCDLLLGTVDVALEHSADGKQRRSMYGQPGKHRLQPWGVEYRTMSNTWTISPEVTAAVLGLAEVVHQVIENKDASLVFDLTERFDIYSVADAILACNRQQCLETAVGVAEELSAVGYSTKRAIDLIVDISASGGVVKTHGYSLERWK